MQAVSGLEFLADRDYADILRQDATTAHTALANAEWKDATVMAGSVIEALLLTALLQEQSTDPISFNGLAGRVSFWPQNNDLLDRRCSLATDTEIAKAAGVISPAIAIQCAAMRWFRNLIHP